jgi:hypothetical protein
VLLNIGVPISLRDKETVAHSFQFKFFDFVSFAFHHVSFIAGVYKVQIFLERKYRTRVKKRWSLEEGMKGSRERHICMLKSDHTSSLN